VSIVEVREYTLSTLLGRRARRLDEVRATFRGERWQAGYRRRLMVTDTVLMAFAVLVALAVATQAMPAATGTPFDTPMILVVSGLALLAASLPVFVALTKGYDPRVFGSGPEEFQRVFGGTWRVFAVLALAALVLDRPGLRGFFLVAFPVSLVLLLLGRWGWRRHLVKRRRRGEYTTAMLAVGLRDQAERLITELHARSSGYRVVGVCVAGDDISPGEEICGVPILGDLHEAAAVATSAGAECVAVSGSDVITADAVRQLGWELEPIGVDLMLTAELADVAGPRITVTPEQSVSLLHVDAPRFAGPKYLAKTCMDWCGALLLTLLVLPVIAVVALAVAVTSRGPVLYRQERVGRHGETFPMLKFRSMRVGADAEQVVLDGENHADGVLFKHRDDPRVTRVGKVLRRYSLDELPQLFNVLACQMSLVGPRPPLPHEVSRYEARMRRRLLVKPGITGLWQVGGRSDLPWKEAVRLDVYYAENWTPFGDLLILARTAKVVLTGRGAY
jgi:exopolysaccharide biosynthesis polyprenyl glycosylphosphotransferase